MDPVVAAIISGLICLILGGGLCWFIFKQISRETFRRREDVLDEARKEADKVNTEAKKEGGRIRDTAEADIRERRKELKQFENRLN